MIREGRKKSTDPNQERLRSAKEALNKEVSSFINDLIHFKRMLNGWPSKFHQERSKIIEPIPADPATIINSLAGDFQDIASKSNKIIRDQLEYSISRRKKQQKQPPSPGIDLTKQLSLPLTASSSYQLYAEGSNAISRFFTKLFNLPIGFGKSAEIRRARLGMLSSCVKAYKNLGKYQIHILRSSGLGDAEEKLREIYNNWILVSRAYRIYKQSNSVEVEDKGGPIKHNVDTQPKEETSAQEHELSPKNKLEKLAKDYLDNYKALPKEISGLDSVKQLNSLIEKYILSKYKKLPTDFAKHYSTALSDSNKHLNINALSFADVVAQSNIKTAQIEKTAQDFIKKWIGKTLLQLNPFDATANYKLNCYKLAEELKSDINEVMDLLEKGLDENKLDPLIVKIDKKISSLKGIMHSLYMSNKD